VTPPGPGRYELHCHLDASVRLGTITDLAKAQGLDLPGPVRDLAVAPADIGSLHGFLPYIDTPLRVLQTAAALERAAQELVEAWSLDGVVYGETRFAPQLHERAGLTLDEAIAAVARGLRAGQDRLGVRAALILCCLRHQDPETSLRVADAAVRHPGLVVGIDLAGDERLPGATHLPAFELAHGAGLPVTVHAGEAAGPESVWEAIDVLGARRVGHGVRCATDPELVRRLARDRIALETCPRCNVLTKAVPSMAQHPAPFLLEQGVPVTVSTDARTTADTTLDREFDALAEAFGWGEDAHEAVQGNARAAAFAAPPGTGALQTRPDGASGAAGGDRRP
jgi:adenosine deaminase